MTSPDDHRGFTTLGVRRLPRDSGCAAAGRAFTRDHLHDVPERQLEPVVLTVSELVSNALKHGRGVIELRLSRAPDRVRVEVIDEGTGAMTAIRRRPGDAHGGWGLRIVDDLALVWGCHEGTTHVWAELRLSDGDQPL
jgi:anti-sigma regulatory factor (Ser/Thr protein kinase)